ncbi:hypothetical protein [Streptomyces sp. NPDC001165]|uniref:hypothetical protein n=1 Tax=Streptomyces sp. NPDC001165 TaxID=3364546 RepID=UPI0036A076AC
MTCLAQGQGHGEPQLSCYTANLVALLSELRPGAYEFFAASIRLAIRPDGPDGRIAFSHHERVDLLDGRELGYGHARRWADARDALRDELLRSGQVIAVAHSALLPWAPVTPEGSGVPHWIRLLDEREDGWLVEDRFDALLPHGAQQPFLGRLDDEQIRRIMTPVARKRPEVRLRDRLALGREVPPPDDGDYSWLAFMPSASPDQNAGRAAAADEAWIEDPAEVCAVLAQRLAADPALLEAHLEDLWAASRHQRFRLRSPAVRALVGEAAADQTAAAWDELPVALRFAAESARRGRTRPGVVRQVFARLADSPWAVASVVCS